MKIEPYAEPEPEKKIRLLVCEDCHTIEEVPDFDGPSQYDQLLTYKVAQHQFDNTGRHGHKLDLGRVSVKAWMEGRKEVIDRIHQEHGHADPGLGEEFYNLKSTFKEDAFTCWSVGHNRTKDCGDYRSDSKALLADTKAERKAEGMATDWSSRPKHWLCDYCPYESLVQQKRNKQNKLYD